MIKNYFESLFAGTDSFSGLAAVLTAVALEQDFALVPDLQQDFLVEAVLTFVAVAALDLQQAFFVVAVLTVVADALAAVQAVLDFEQVLVAVVLVAAAFAAAA